MTIDKINKIKIKVESEVGELQTVILHKPGSEIENMTPENAKRALIQLAQLALKMCFYILIK